MAVIFVAIPSTASAAITLPVGVSAAAASSGTVSATAYCENNAPPPGQDFWRCNGSGWVGIPCSSPSDNNATTDFTVLYAEDNCSYRVWLHEDTSPLDATEGWSYCISPTTVPAAFQELSPENQNPENIQVTSNETGCPGTTQAEPPAGYTHITTGQGMCLDDTNDIGRDGWPVQLWTCATNLNQGWQAEPDGTIRNANGSCLGTGSAANSYAATANGTGLVMVACSQHYLGSYWTVSPFAHQIINKYADAAMDNTLDLQQNGNPVQLWSTATGSPESQDWTAVPSGGGTPVVTPGNPPALHTDGANMVTATGQVFVPRGFTLSTLQSTQPSHDGAHAFSDVLSETEAQIDAIAGAWHGNIVRLQIEQDDLVQGGVNGGENTDYLNLIRAAVSYAKAKGLVVVLNAQTEPGNGGRVTSQEPMPTAETEHFWGDLAQYYGNDASVIIDPFNEPRATSGLSVGQFMTLWNAGGSYTTPATSTTPSSTATYIGFEVLASWLRSNGYATNMLWVEPPGGSGDQALAGLTDGGNYLLTNPTTGDRLSNVSYSFHHPTVDAVDGTATRTPANWDTEFGDLVRLDELSVSDGEWNTRSIQTNWVSKYNGDSGPCWSDAPTAVPQYFAYLQKLGVGLTAWTLTDGAQGAGMTADSDPGTFTTTANFTGWPNPDACVNATPVLGPGALLMAWFGQQAGS